MFRVFDLAGVSRAEADAMRQALSSSRVPYYETPGDTGRSGAAIWVRSEAAASKAREVIATAQVKWVENALRNQPPERSTRWTQLTRVRKLVVAGLSAAFVWYTLSLVLPGSTSSAHWDVRGSAWQLYLLLLNLPVVLLWLWLLKPRSRAS